MHFSGPVIPNGLAMLWPQEAISIWSESFDAYVIMFGIFDCSSEFLSLSLSHSLFLSPHCLQCLPSQVLRMQLCLFVSLNSWECSIFACFNDIEKRKGGCNRWYHRGTIHCRHHCKPWINFQNRSHCLQMLAESWGNGFDWSSALNTSNIFQHWRTIFHPVFPPLPAARAASATANKRGASGKDWAIHCATSMLVVRSMKSWGAWLHHMYHSCFSTIQHIALRSAILHPGVYLCTVLQEPNIRAMRQKSYTDTDRNPLTRVNSQHLTAMACYGYGKMHGFPLRKWSI